jgi:hypothetical protein
MVLKNDRLAVQAAIKTCNILDKRKVRLVRIKSTKELDSVEVTPNLLEEVNEHPNMASNGNVYSFPFDATGHLF